MIYHIMATIISLDCNLAPMNQSGFPVFKLYISFHLTETFKFNGVILIFYLQDNVIINMLQIAICLMQFTLNLPLYTLSEICNKQIINFNGELCAHCI